MKKDRLTEYDVNDLKFTDKQIQTGVSTGPTPPPDEAVSLSVVIARKVSDIDEYRIVNIALTPEQRDAIRLKCVGHYRGTPFYERISLVVVQTRNQ